MFFATVCRVEKLTKESSGVAKIVLEKLATSDKATIVVERLTDGKIRVTSDSRDREKVIVRDQVLEYAERPPTTRKT